MEPSSASPFNPFKSKKIIRSSSKSASSDETLDSDQNPLSSKAQRSQCSSRDEPETKIGSGSSVNPDSTSSKAEGSIKLPEKYEILGEFFSSMDSSIRLLRLKRSMSSFTNICPKIESLTDLNLGIKEFV
ncbi:hypothetical protein HHK36_032328 [Tetracentron sinense]|uniref:Uncharacterized protein n=1 Tax=Tetracentron sinense TaxID=13715 RepID=A0A834Y5A4_TETSI|nr:hypothetical protein HHK36_032328 [Tetracentron sinense]